MKRLHPSLSIEKITATWRQSRDSSPSKAGAAGIDGVTASEFKAKLSDNITAIRSELRASRFVFSRLRVAAVSKPSGGHRIIAVPTVRDRLVQRALLKHLQDDRRFVIGSDVSYGFTKGRTLPDAQRAAKALRERHPWMLQVDIIKFFDRIPRDQVKALVRRRVGSKSIAGIICQAIDCELDQSPGRHLNLPELSAIQKGRGLRQGMPLSPMLSNLLLQRFDQDLGRRGIRALRYADDIAVFCDSEAECLRALDLMKTSLKAVELDIPDLAQGIKTQISEPSVTAAFLGIEIRRCGTGKYNLCAPAKRIADIQSDMKRIATLSACLDNRIDLGKLLRLLDSLVIGHKAAMMVLDDPSDFLCRLEAAKRKAVDAVLVELLGHSAVQKLDDRRRAVLGLTPFPAGTLGSGSRTMRRRR